MLYNIIIEQKKYKEVFMGKWNRARKILLVQTNRYNSERTTKIRSVHQTILARALMILKI